MQREAYRSNVQHEDLSFCELADLQARAHLSTEDARLDNRLTLVCFLSSVLTPSNLFAMSAFDLKNRFKLIDEPPQQEKVDLQLSVDIW